MGLSSSELNFYALLTKLGLVVASVLGWSVLLLPFSMYNSAFSSYRRTKQETDVMLSCCQHRSLGIVRLRIRISQSVELFC